MDKDWIAEDWYQMQHDLLVKVKLVGIDGVEPGLGGGSRSKEERIDVGKVAGGEQDD